MRLWSLSLKYLDQKGLCGLWTESILAQKVLMGQTEAYKNHPQLIRWKCDNSDYLISRYLWSIWHEGEGRGYHFIWQKIWKHEQNLPEWVTKEPCLTVTKGQLEYEFKHLQSKLEKRCQDQFYKNLINNNCQERKGFAFREVEVNPIFEVVEGGIESWEKLND